MEGFPKRMSHSYGFWLSAKPLNCKVRFRIFFFLSVLVIPLSFFELHVVVSARRNITKNLSVHEIKKTKNKTKQLKTSLLRFRESQSDFFHHQTFFF